MVKKIYFPSSAEKIQKKNRYENMLECLKPINKSSVDLHFLQKDRPLGINQENNLLQNKKLQTAFFL